MKKTPKAKPSTSSNTKITSFFTRFSPLPIEIKSKEVSNDCVVLSDEDIIEESPVKTRASVLYDVTNKVGADRKRKLCDKLEDFQTKKKNCTENDVMSKAELDCIVEDSIDARQFCGNVDSFVEDLVFLQSPKKDIKVEISSNIKLGLSTPPKLKLYPNKATTSKASPKASPKQRAGAQISPEKKGSAKKKTPLKLFEKSPSVGEFQVDVLRNFVKVTPSKSERPPDNRSPFKSCEKRQQSILLYISPSASEKSAGAQNENEKTPPASKVVRKVATPSSSSRVKVKLDFSNSFPIKDGQPEEKDDSEELRFFENSAQFGFELHDSWEENFEFTGSYCLDLAQPQHCKVLETTKTNLKQTLILQSTKNDEKAICILIDFWVNVKLDPGNVVFVSAIQNSKQEWIVDNQNGLLIFEPDHLVSSTSVAGALFCKRKSILREKFPGFDPCNKVMTVGTMVHGLLQQCLRDNIETAEEITAVVNRMLSSEETVWTLYETALSRSEMETELMSFVPRIVSFLQQYMRGNEGRYVERRNVGDWKGKIDAVEDIEENIWCHELGVKGKVDVSVRNGEFVMPLELKTGRASMSLEHRGQVILYIMMMKKLGYKVPSGLLLYLREGVVRDVQITQQESRDLILLRNELTYYLSRRPRPSQTEQVPSDANAIESSHLLLPPPINHHSACGRCEYNTVCCLYLKNEGSDLKEFKHLREVQDDVLSHLTQEHVNYFIRFCRLLELEGGSNCGKQLREIYTKSPEIREKSGKCILNVKIAGEVSECSNLYSTKFQKSEMVNLLASGIGESSYVVVSTSSRPAISSGIVSEMDNTSVTIQLDRDLRKKYGEEMSYHLDTYESNSVNAFNYANLSLLMAATERSGRLRALVIDKEAPTFKKTLPAEVGRKAAAVLKRMNKTQQRAVIKALAANDYLLVKGMPGTGKTATIVALVQFLVELKQTVLITSHTHSAVDNVCVRLQQIGVDVLRLGAESRVHHSLKSRTERALTKHCRSPEELDSVYSDAAVLAVTCIGSKHAVLSKRVFDVCIVDESTQVLQCAVFRALSVCRKFVLIGDPDQLPPVVKNNDARAAGLSESLFERLQSPESTVTLNLNYRMNGPITKLANDITYKGDLLIANDSVKNATLRLSKNLRGSYEDRRWLLQALDDKLENSICVLDTGPVWNRNFRAPWIRKPSIERNEDDEVLVCSNPAETAVIFHIVKALIKAGLSARCIGVIAPYRAQVAQIAQVLAHLQVDISTVDQFQGQDKEVIVYSCTKSRDTAKPRKIGKFEILEDKRRLTVAVTRAKHKLIVVADVGTIREYKPFSGMFDAIPKGNYLNVEDGRDGFSWNELVECCGNW